MAQRHLVSLSDGIYTVPGTCRILGGGMTSRKIHYWLDTGLISGPMIQGGGKGIPTLLTFRQLLEIRTVQHLRDEIKVPLSTVRQAFAWILDHAFNRGEDVIFERAPYGGLVARTSEDSCELVPSGQGVFPIHDVNVAAMTTDLDAARQAWRDQRLRLRDHVVTDTHVLAGSPTVEGTRIETSIIATFAVDGHYDDDVVASVVDTYPHLAPAAVVDAFHFEHIPRAA